MAAPPTPVPSVSMTISFEPRPAPAYHSPSSAVRASFSRRSGKSNSVCAQPARSNSGASLYLPLILRIRLRFESTRPQKLNPMPRQRSDLGQLSSNRRISGASEETKASRLSVLLAGIVSQASIWDPEIRAQAAWLPPTSTARMLIHFYFKLAVPKWEDLAVCEWMLGYSPPPPPPRISGVIQLARQCYICLTQLFIYIRVEQWCP